MLGKQSPQIYANKPMFISKICIILLLLENNVSWQLFCLFLMTTLEARCMKIHAQGAAGCPSAWPAPSQSL